MIKDLELIPSITMYHGAEDTLRRLKGNMIGVSRIFKFDPIKNKLLSLIGKTIRNVENASNQRAPSAETLHIRSLELNGFKGERGRQLFEELKKRARDIRKKERDLQYYNK